MERLNLVKECFILGTDRLDAEKLADAYREQACSASFYNGGIRRALSSRGKGAHRRRLHRKKIAVKNMAMLSVIRTPLRISSRVKPS
jgi:hypothetical protein